jgi:putative acetyltransferase
MKLNHFSFLLLSSSLSLRAIELEIRPIQLHQVNDVKQMIIECAFELSHSTCTLEEFAHNLEIINEFEDLVDIQTSYTSNNGIFLVLLDEQKVVGSGAIRKFNDEICELMRLWLFKEYRGKGFGSKMMQQLLEFAKNNGYKKIRLDVYYPNQQSQALALYKKFGFYEIPAYNNNPAQLWMEKIL